MLQNFSASPIFQGVMIDLQNGFEVSFWNPEVALPQGAGLQLRSHPGGGEVAARRVAWQVQTLAAMGGQQRGPP